MNKKRIFAIITFIILGLFMFAFANPLNDNGEENNANQAATGNTTNDTTENEQVLPEPDNNETTQRNATRNNTRRVIARVDNTTTLDLTIDKANAIDELKKYKDEYQFTDDSAYNKVIDDYTTKINDSTTLDDINKNLDEGKNKIDEVINEDLTAYKEAAKKDIKEYAESLNLVTDYTDLLNEYNNKIDDATTKKAIDKLVSDAKKALDEMKANEVAEAKEKAFKDINEYKQEDQEYIKDITTTKDEGLKEVEASNDVKEIENIVEETKNKIDDLIKNTTFTVNFYHINTHNSNYELLDTQTVHYTKSAKTPEIKKEVTTFYGRVINKFVGWDKDFTEVKTNLDVYANYEVTNVTGSVYVVKEESSNKERLTTDDYERIVKNIEVKLTDDIINAVNTYSKGHEVIVATDDATIRSIVSTELPTLYKGNKYKTIEFYVLKVTGDGVHVDGRIHYDKDAELADKKDAAIDEIKKYRTDDEQYIEEITTIKNDFENNLDNINNLEDLEKAVKDTKKAIDDAIKNKKFTVTFYGIKGKVLSTQSVTYNTAANIPDTSGTVTEWNGSIELKFLNWDVKDSALKHVKGNLEVQAKYDVVSATTKISILKEDLGYDYSTNIDDFNHPYNKPEVEKDKYFELTITKEIVDAVNDYRNKHIIVYSDNDEKIREVLKGEPDVFNNNKYKKLQYYVLKLQGDRFHCDARVIYDRDAEELDKAKAELKELIEKAKKLDTTNKTDKSVEDLNNKISKAKDNYKGTDINAIKESINELKDIKLVDIKVTDIHVKVNKDKYYDYATKFDITVTYDDNNGKKNEKTDDYKVTALDKTEGKHTATVTYKGQSKTFEYTTVINKIESIKVVNHVPTYWKNQKEDITVTATYTDDTTKELSSDKYRLDNFKTSSATTKRTATVVLNSNNNITDKFDYAVSKYSSKEEEDEAIEAEAEAERVKAIKAMKVTVPDGKYYIEFNKLPSGATVNKVYKKGNISTHTITLKSSSVVDGKLRYEISKTDHAIIRATNGEWLNQYIYIEYIYGDKLYLVQYNEKTGNLKLVSVNRI